MKSNFLNPATGLKILLVAGLFVACGGAEPTREPTATFAPGSVATSIPPTPLPEVKPAATPKPQLVCSSLADAKNRYIDARQVARQILYRFD